MAITFGMPSLGHTMEKGKIIEWLKQEGDTIAKGEPFVIIETDKVITEVESPSGRRGAYDCCAIRRRAPHRVPAGAVGAAQGEQVSEVELQQCSGLRQRQRQPRQPPVRQRQHQ